MRTFALPMSVKSSLLLALSAPLLAAAEPATPAPTMALAPTGTGSTAVVPVEVQQGQVIGLEPIAAINDEDYQLFKAREMFFDLNYLYAESDGYGSAHGGGASFGYYLTHMFGGQLDVIAMNGPTSDFMASAGITARLPVDFAATAFIFYLGGGYQTGETNEFNLQYGAGLEFRMTEHTGVVLDFRGVDPESSEPVSIFRLGVRFIF